MNIFPLFIFYINSVSGERYTTTESPIEKSREGGQAIHSHLVDSLFKNYDKHVLPLQKNTSQPVEVAAGLAMIHMDELTETGVLSATTWFRLVWNDFRLKHEDLPASKVLRINPSKVWLPDIEVFNMAGTSQLSIAPQYYNGVNVLVYPDGEVLFIPQIKIKVHCYNFSHSNWPQGEQDCNIKLGSWTYDSLGLNLTAFNNKFLIDLEDMAPSSPWLITKQYGDTLNHKKYNCCVETYPELNFRFRMKPQYLLKDPRAVEYSTQASGDKYSHWSNHCFCHSLVDLSSEEKSVKLT